MDKFSRTVAVKKLDKIGKNILQFLEEAGETKGGIGHPDINLRWDRVPTKYKGVFLDIYNDIQMGRWHVAFLRESYEELFSVWVTDSICDQKIEISFPKNFNFCENDQAFRFLDGMFEGLLSDSLDGNVPKWTFPPQYENRLSRAIFRGRFIRLLATNEEWVIQEVSPCDGGFIIARGGKHIPPEMEEYKDWYEGEIKLLLNISDFEKVWDVC